MASIPITTYDRYVLQDKHCRTELFKTRLVHQLCVVPCLDHFVLLVIASHQSQSGVRNAMVEESQRPKFPK